MKRLLLLGAIMISCGTEIKDPPTSGADKCYVSFDTTVKKTAAAEVSWQAPIEAACAPYFEGTGEIYVRLCYGLKTGASGRAISIGVGDKKQTIEGEFKGTARELGNRPMTVSQATLTLENVVPATDGSVFSAASITFCQDAAECNQACQ